MWSILLSILSFILAAVSIVFVVLNIKQNNKILESSIRPYISIYLDAITICEQDSYFIIKNFGQSPAQITEFQFPEILTETQQASTLHNDQFHYVTGVTLAPGQACLMPYMASSLPDEDLEFIISYQGLGKAYTEQIRLNPRMHIRIPKKRPESKIPKGNEREIHTLREILERII